MKHSTRTKGPRQEELPRTNPLPDPPVLAADVNYPVHEIRQAEILAFVSALDTFRAARADFEKKRGDLFLRLYLLCECERGDYFASLENDNNTLVVVDMDDEYDGAGRPVKARWSVPAFGAV